MAIGIPVIASTPMGCYHIGVLPHWGTATVLAGCVHEFGNDTFRSVCERMLPPGTGPERARRGGRVAESAALSRLPILRSWALYDSFPQSCLGSAEPVRGESAG